MFLETMDAPSLKSHVTVHALDLLSSIFNNQCTISPCWISFLLVVFAAGATSGILGAVFWLLSTVVGVSEESTECKQINSEEEWKTV
jgi:hypothetical protein